MKPDILLSRLPCEQANRAFILNRLNPDILQGRLTCEQAKNRAVILNRLNQIFC